MEQQVVPGICSLPTKRLAKHDLPGLPFAQGRVDIVRAVRKRVGQIQSVGGRFRSARCRMGPRNCRGVAQNHYPPIDHLVGGQVTNSLSKRLWRGFHDRAKPWGEQFAGILVHVVDPLICQHAFWHRIAALPALPISHDLGQLLRVLDAIPHPVV
ncbi:hypothetical protein D3C86_1337430 [compost metagenome]